MPRSEFRSLSALLTFVALLLSTVGIAADAVGRDAYLTHPAHKQFVELISGKIEEVLVVDFWSNGTGKVRKAGDSGQRRNRESRKN